MYAVEVVSRFIQSPVMHHLSAVKRILYYLAGMTDYGLHYVRNDQFKLIRYSDND